VLRLLLFLLTLDVQRVAQCCSSCVKITCTLSVLLRKEAVRGNCSCRPLCRNFQFKLPMTETLAVLCTARNTPTSQTFEYALTQNYTNSITRNSCYRIFSIKGQSIYPTDKKSCSVMEIKVFVIHTTGLPILSHISPVHILTIRAQIHLFAHSACVELRSTARHSFEFIR